MLSSRSSRSRYARCSRIGTCALMRVTSPIASPRHGSNWISAQRWRPRSTRASRFISCSAGRVRKPRVTAFARRFARSHRDVAVDLPVMRVGLGGVWWRWPDQRCQLPERVDSQRIERTQRSNQAMQRTAGRSAITLSMIPTPLSVCDARPRPRSLILFSLDGCWLRVTVAHRRCLRSLPTIALRERRCGRFGAGPAPRHARAVRWHALGSASSAPLRLVIRSDASRGSASSCGRLCFHARLCGLTLCSLAACFRVHVGTAGNVNHLTRRCSEPRAALRSHFP